MSKSSRDFRGSGASRVAPEAQAEAAAQVSEGVASAPSAPGEAGAPAKPISYRVVEGRYITSISGPKRAGEKLACKDFLEDDDSQTIAHLLGQGAIVAAE